MSVAATRTETPASREEAAALIADCSRRGLRVRVRGAGTKLGWGNVVPDPDVEVSTLALDRVIEHNAGDLTAVLEAGVRIADAERRFRDAGQMLALDVPDGDATIGGVVATGDSGPLRQRHGAPRDLVLGVAVALSGGELARAGGKVIKNVAGYDLAKLFAGSFGTLGAIVEVAVRLHPLPHDTATVVAATDDPAVLAATATRLAQAPLEPQALDVSWSNGEGRILLRCTGRSAGDQAAEIAAGLEGLETSVVPDDDAIWQEQRSRQRSSSGCVVRVSGRQAELERVVRATDRLGGSLVGRAALGLSWVSIAGADEIVALRDDLAPFPCVVLDAPAEVRRAIDPWGEAEAIDLMRRVKERFDPTGTFNPGVFVGGI